MQTERSADFVSRLLAILCEYEDFPYHLSTDFFWGNMQEGLWLPITEYARIKGISISTVRRYIKADRLSVKQDDGRFLIYVPSGQAFEFSEARDMLELRLENERLKQELRRLYEETNDLRMLVVLYEKGEAPPAVPN